MRAGLPLNLKMLFSSLAAALVWLLKKAARCKLIKSNIEEK